DSLAPEARDGGLRVSDLDSQMAESGWMSRGGRLDFEEGVAADLQIREYGLAVLFPKCEGFAESHGLGVVGNLCVVVLDRDRHVIQFHAGVILSAILSGDGLHQQNSRADAGDKQGKSTHGNLRNYFSS